MATTCPNCQETNPPQMLFCRRCGQKLPSAAGQRFVLMLLGALVAGGIAVATIMLMLKPTATSPATVAELQSLATPADAGTITVGVAFGTEKQDWLKTAAAQFQAGTQGKGIKIQLLPMGSLEAAQAIVKGDRSINVWSPASALYKDVFVRDWKGKNGDQANPIFKEAQLAFTPMVFVMWDERYQAFKTRYPELTFGNISKAMGEEGGWRTIANKPDWYFFKFSHTHPNRSNSGLMALVLMAHDFHDSGAALSGSAITNTQFKTWLQNFERSLQGSAGDLIPSTDTLMTDMIRKGASTYDAIMVYESVAINRRKQAEGRQDKIRVVYPRFNMWSDNPYYILDTPWSTPQQRQAARTFLDFLLSDSVQADAMAHGFRPANLNILTKSVESPFQLYEDIGLLQNPPGQFVSPPRAEVIENLLLMWQMSQRDR